MSSYSIPPLLSAIVFAGLGLFVLLSNRRSATNIMFMLMCATSFGWQIAWTFLFSIKDSSLADLIVRCGYSSIIFIPICHFHLFASFVGKLKEELKLLFASYVLGVVFLVLLWSTDLFIRGYYSFHWGYYPKAGILHPVYLAMVNVLAFRLTYLLVMEWRRKGLDPQRYQQVKFALIGFLFYFMVVSDFLVNYGIEFYPLGFIPGVISFGIFAYAIFRHQLLDIEVVVKRTVQFAGLVAAVVGVVSLVAFVSQDLLAHFIAIPKWLSNVLAAAIIAGLYGPLNAWLTNVTEKYLFQKKYDYRQVLKKFNDEVMVQLNLDQLVKMTVETLTETVKLDGCSLLLVNKDTRQYELVASKGTNGQKVVFEEREPFITFLRETHEPIGRDGELGKVRFPDAVTERMKQLNARLCLPMDVHDELIGVLCLGKKKSDEEFTKDDLDVLLPVAKTLGIAVSNAQLVDELKKTQAEAAQREKLAVIGTLSAGINHEICNPLGIVKAQCEAFLLDQQDGILIGKSAQDVLDRTTTIMQVALKQIDRATAITQKLSNFAKPIKDAVAQQVSVAQEIDEVLLLVGHDLKLDKIEVMKEIDPNLPPIVADRRQLQEVLFNLIRNAGQAIKPPGTITVRAYTGGGDHVRIEIEDTGSGIAPDKLGKIYDPFFTTKEPGKGTGLGLFIVRQIVERNKGRISVESTVGKGTIFFLEFPVAKAAAVAV